MGRFNTPFLGRPLTVAPDIVNTIYGMPFDFGQELYNNWKDVFYNDPVPPDTGAVLKYPFNQRQRDYEIFLNALYERKLSSDGVFDFKEINSLIKTGSFQSLKIDPANHGMVELLFDAAYLLPHLLRNGWLTYDNQNRLYHLTYDGKGLDHTNISFGSLPNSSIGLYPIRDNDLLRVALTYAQFLRIPQNEIDRLHALTQNLSGDEVFSANLKIGVLVFAAVAATYTAYASIGAGAATGATPVEETAPIAATGAPPAGGGLTLTQIGEASLESLKTVSETLGTIKTAESLGKEIGVIKTPKTTVTVPAPAKTVSTPDNISSGIGLAGGIGLLALLAFL